MEQILPAPRTTRELIELFAAYDRQEGIDALLGGVDFSCCDIETAITMALGPQSAERIARAVA